ncbi:flavin reductase family protein [Actinocorallia longicatena]|uniref:Flavin reductase family protein n=1 Tax=Actinocorallia longicatena TaxID=111803 RepID=A0ABP6Q1N2_9ACTN
MTPAPEPADPRPDLTVAAFRRVAGRFATGITVVTTVADGRDHAMTMNAFTSVSLDPLLVLFCVEKIARFHDTVLAQPTWAVSILGEHSEAASSWFATRGRPLEAGLDGWKIHRGPRTGAPILDEAIGALECRTHAVHDAGDHTIVVGEVLAATTPAEAGPLIYFNGTYRTLREPA